MAWPTTTRDTSYLVKRGSAYTAMQEVQESGVPLSPTPDTVHPIGFLQSGTYNREVTTESEIDAGGGSHDTGDTTEAILTLKVMQRDVITLEAPKTFTGNARVYQELSSAKLGAAGDKGQIGVINSAKFRRTFGWNLEDMFPEWEMVCTPNTSGSAITVDVSAFTGGLGAGVGNATIGAGEYEDIVEFTYA